MTTPPGSTGPNGNADRLWLRTDLPVEARVEALLAEMTLAVKVGQTHQSANIDPVADAELIRGGGIGSSLLASGATAGNERDAGIRVSTIDAVQQIAVEESRLGIPLLFARSPRSVGHLPSSTHARPTGRPIAAADDPVTGRYLDALVLPRFPFGWGLTYTSFSYGPIRLSSHEMPLNGGSIEVSVDVTNSGTRPGREVVQLYLRDVVADVTRPLLELADWVSLELNPGATGRATFDVTPAQLSYYDRTMTLRVDPGGGRGHGRPRRIQWRFCPDHRYGVVPRRSSEEGFCLWPAQGCGNGGGPRISMAPVLTAAVRIRSMSTTPAGSPLAIGSLASR